MNCRKTYRGRKDGQNRKDVRDSSWFLPNQFESGIADVSDRGRSVVTLIWVVANLVRPSEHHLGVERRRRWTALQAT